MVDVASPSRPLGPLLRPPELHWPLLVICTTVSLVPQGPPLCSQLLSTTALCALRQACVYLSQTGLCFLEDSELPRNSLWTESRLPSTSTLYGRHSAPVCWSVCLTGLAATTAAFPAGTLPLTPVSCRPALKHVLPDPRPDWHDQCGSQPCGRHEHPHSLQPGHASHATTWVLWTGQRARCW